MVFLKLLVICIKSSAYSLGTLVFAMFTLLGVDQMVCVDAQHCEHLLASWAPTRLLTIFSIFGMHKFKFSFRRRDFHTKTEFDELFLVPFWCINNRQVRCQNRYWYVMLLHFFAYHIINIGWSFHILNKIFEVKVKDFLGIYWLYQ